MLDGLPKELPGPNESLSKMVSPSAIIMANDEVSKTNRKASMVKVNLCGIR